LKVSYSCKVMYKKKRILPVKYTFFKAGYNLFAGKNQHKVRNYKIIAAAVYNTE